MGGWWVVHTAPTSVSFPDDEDSYLSLPLEIFHSPPVGPRLHICCPEVSLAIWMLEDPFKLDRE